MIEPRLYTDHEPNLLLVCFDKTIPPHFAIEFAKDGSGVMLAYTTVWTIIKHDKSPCWVKYFYQSILINKDDFWALVSNQPEIFEWLLFHPEWF